MFFLIFCSSVFCGDTHNNSLPNSQSPISNQTFFDSLPRNCLVDGIGLSIEELSQKAIKARELSERVKQHFLKKINELSQEKTGATGLSGFA